MLGLILLALIPLAVIWLGAIVSMLGPPEDSPRRKWRP